MVRSCARDLSVVHLNVFNLNFIPFSRKTAWDAHFRKHYAAPNQLAANCSKSAPKTYTRLLSFSMQKISDSPTKRDTGDFVAKVSAKNLTL